MIDCRFKTPKAASLLLITFLFCWHLILAGQVNLSVDEAHYALYGVKPDWSYFDHPPMVGWLNILPTYFSHSDWSLRVLPITFFTLSMWMTYRISERLFPSFAWIGLWTLVLINSAVMFQLLSLSMLPDTPLMLASLMVFWQLLNLLDADQPKLKDWLWLGFWMGIAGLSKYTAITLVISVLLIMLVERRFDWLKAPGLWLAILLAGFMITPVIYWNATHNWISFLYQIHHGTHNDSWDWRRVLETQLAQLGVYSPLLFVIGWWIAIRTLFIKENPRLLALFALPILVLFAMGSGYEMSLPHWTQLAWLFLAPGVVHWIWQNWHHKPLRIFTYFSSTITLIASLILNTHLLTPWIPFPDNQDMTRELHGWTQAVERAKNYQQQFPNTPLFAANWSQASRIAWYAYPQPVYITDTRLDQFDLWYGNPKPGSNGILILPSYESDQPELKQPAHFNQCNLLETLPIQAHQHTLVTYRLFYCQGFEPFVYDGWQGELPLAKQHQTP